MPQLPDFTALGERPAPQLPRRTPNIAEYQATSGMESVPAQELAGSAQHMQAAASIAMAMQEQQDTLRAEEGFNQLRQKQIDLTSGQNGYANLKGGNAVNQPILKTYGAQFDQAAQDISNGLDNDFQRKRFAQRAQIAGLQLRQGIVQHIAQQSDVQAVDNYKNTFKTEINAASADPSQTEFSIARLTNASKEYARRFGKSDEFVANDVAAAKGEILSSQLGLVAITDPKLAYEKFNNPEIFKAIPAAQREVLSRQIMAGLIPAQANDIVGNVFKTPQADQVISDIKVRGDSATQEVSQVLNGAPASGDDLHRRNIASIQDEISKQKNNPKALAILNQELASEQSLLAGTPSQGSNVVPLRPAAQSPIHRVDIQARIGEGIAKVRADAMSMWPNDPQTGAHLADIAEQKFKAQMASVVQAQQGIERQSANWLKGKLNGIDEKGNRTQPQSLPDLLASDPQARTHFSNLSEGSQAAMYKISDMIANHALGNPSKISKGLEQKLLERMVLPPDDPNAITRESQLNAQVQNGLALPELNGLVTKLQSINAGGRQVQTWVAKTRSTAQGMLVGAMTSEALAHPDLAREAASRFNRALDDQIDQLRKDGKETEIPNLFIPGSKDYVLDPNKVQSFMPTQQQIMAAKAQGSKTGAPIQTYDIGKEYTFKQGKMRYKGGDPKNADNWTVVK